MKHIALVAGARPNFMKIAPIYAELQRRDVTPFLIHTGQHYDAVMSKIFFDELGLPQPDINLGAGGKTADEQKKEIKEKLSTLFRERTFDVVVVVGDVTSTLAAAEAAHEANIPVAHVEAGLRSRNNAMPEEHNRIETDKISSFLFTTEPVAEKNLRAEGVKGNIWMTGNVMIDTLRKFEAKADLETDAVLASAGLTRGEPYALATLHRPENVDDPVRLAGLLSALEKTSEKIRVVFSVHPRTEQHMAGRNFGRPGRLDRFPPQTYLAMLALVKHARFVMTDSGGLQEETTALDVPCLTLRTETERPITVEAGTNEVVGVTAETILPAVDRVLAGQWKKGRVPELWDGHAAERIADILIAS